MLPTGKVEVVTGTTPHGQGHVTAWSQIVADALGVPFEDVNVIYGDTQSSPQGHGHLRLALAGRRRRRRAPGRARRSSTRPSKVAAHLLEAAEGDLEFTGGTFSVKGSPDAKTTIQEVALATFAAHNLPDGMEPTLDADAVLDPENFSFPHGTHLCAVEVDTETGRPKIRKYVAVDDVGKVINPLIVEGQVHGGHRPGHRPGAVRGGGLRRRRQPGHRHDGRLPGPVGGGPAGLRHRPDRDPGDVATRSGVKGVGEAGTIASTPAVVNAVVDALRPLGVQRHPDALHAGAGLAGDQRAGSDGGDRAAEGTIAYGGPQTATTAGGAE